jgi:hypothetical protein
MADQLRPLVEAAIAGRLSAPEQARLERMLIARWRDELELAGLPPAQALRRMREHPEAGQLLEQLEGWLHCPPGAVEVDVAAVLAPYRAHPPVESQDAARPLQQPHEPQEVPG